jgi:hypothetical protein
MLLAAPDYRSVIDAVSRRDQVRVLVDGMTAANALGLTNAVPAKVVVHTDGRLRPIQLGQLIIEFRLTAASKLYWAGRPAMLIVQALHWLRDTLSEQREAIRDRLKVLIATDASAVLRDDLRQGLPTLPAWMQNLLRNVLNGQSICGGRCSKIGTGCARCRDHQCREDILGQGGDPSRSASLV